MKACNTANPLTVQANRISVVVKTSGVTSTIGLDILNAFSQDRA